MLTRLLLLLLLLLGSSPAFATDKADGPYLFDLLKQQAYLSAWKAMLSGEAVPDWVGSYAKTFNGPSTPSKDVPVGADTYTLAWVCKAHDCADNQLYILFAPGGKQAWGLLVVKEKQRFLDHPNEAIQAALKQAVH